MDTSETTVRFSTYLPVDHPLLFGGHEVDENRILKDCLLIPTDDLWETYREHTTELILAPSYYLQFFPAARLDGEYELTELYQVNSDNTDRVLVIGEGVRLENVSYNRYKTALTGSGMATFSPWRSGGFFSGTGCGGCFSGCLSIFGLAAILSLVLCLVMGNCIFLSEWCPCFDSENQEQVAEEEAYGYFECKTPDPTRLQILAIDKNYDPSTIFKLRPEGETVSNHHVFKLPLTDASRIKAYYLVLDSVTTDCNSLKPTSIQVCQMFDTDTCTLFEIQRGRSDSCTQDVVGFESWKDLQMCIALGTAKEIRFE